MTQKDKWYALTDAAKAKGWKAPLGSGALMRGDWLYMHSVLPIVFDPDFLAAIYGTAPHKTGYVHEETLDPLIIPLYEHVAIEVMRAWCMDMDVVDILYEYMQRGKKL